MAGIPGSPPDLRSVPPGCPFHPRCPLAFDPCNTVVPLLRPFPAEQQEQRVACHLYDPRFREEPPDTSILAEKYKALAEGSKVQ